MHHHPQPTYIKYPAQDRIKYIPPNYSILLAWLFQIRQSDYPRFISVNQIIWLNALLHIQNKIKNFLDKINHWPLLTLFSSKKTSLAWMAQVDQTVFQLRTFATFSSHLYEVSSGNLFNWPKHMNIVVNGSTGRCFDTGLQVSGGGL